MRRSRLREQARTGAGASGRAGDGTVPPWVTGSHKHRRPEPGAHVAVAQTSFLGDVILTTPLLSALRTILRPRRVTIVVRPEALPLVAHHPSVDGVVVDDKRGQDRGLTGLLRVAGRLRRERIDLVVAPHRSTRTALVLTLAGIPHRVGFSECLAAPLYHVRVPRDRARHDVERNLGLVEAFGERPGEHVEAPRLVAGARAEERARDLLASLGVDDGRPLFGICPGSVWPTKRWHVDGYAEVVQALRNKNDATVLLLGGIGDQSVADAIQGRSGGAAINLVGRTDLGMFVALTARMRAVISNDSAPMHIAAACRVPVVAIFCATTPAQGYGPYGTDAEVVQAELECRPCGRHGGRQCPRGTEDCMRLVRAGEVLAGLDRMLARRERGHVPALTQADNR